MIDVVAMVIAGVVLGVSAAILIGMMLDAFDTWRRERRELERMMDERAIDEIPGESPNPPAAIDPSRIDIDEPEIADLEIGSLRRRKSNRELRRIRAHRRRMGLR